MKWTILAFVGFTFLGCSTIRAYDYIGFSDHELISEKGTPSQTQKLGDGSEVWEYSRCTGYSIPTDGGPFGVIVTKGSRCSNELFTIKNGIVVDYSKRTEY